MPQKTYMYDTQWNQLINAINTGDSSAVITALNTIKNSLDNITSAISSQSITLDFSNINSNNVSNLSDVEGNTITEALNMIQNSIQNSYIYRLSIPNQQIINSTTYTDIINLTNQNIKKGKYLCIWSINASWTNRYYQLVFRLKIGSYSSEIAASVANPQNNTPISCITFIDIPTDGIYTLSIQASVTNSEKTVTIEQYQNPRLLLIPCFNVIVR